jgi:signal transduction histidine kinase
MQGSLSTVEAASGGICPLTAEPTRFQLRLAGAVSVLLVVALLASLPYAREQTQGTETLLPAYAAALIVVELLTTALLLALFHVQQSRGLLLLAAAYLFSALMAVPWALTFPGVFDELMGDASMQGTASIAAIRRLSFPIIIIAYALLAEREYPAGVVRRMVLLCVAVVSGAAALLSWMILAYDQFLPRLMVDARNVSGLWVYIPAAAVALYLIGLVSLGLRRRSTLDIWLMVVLLTLLLEILLLSYASAGARLSFGWWSGRLFGLASASVVLLVLLAEATTVHARLARSIMAERRARQSRLTTMEALSASIVHEVTQPLATMVNNASAGLRWLAHDKPEIDEAQTALGRIVTEGHRAGILVASIRTLFTKRTQEREPLELNRMIEAVMDQSRDEGRLRNIAVSIDLADEMPPVLGNSAQISQTIVNLVDNAIDSMRRTPKPRSLHVSSQSFGTGEVMVAIADSGTGLAAADKDRIFDPFFTTKPDGMGMGLMFCRTTIEAHGGRLLGADNEPRGAVFQFTLPALAGASAGSAPAP